MSQSLPNIEQTLPSEADTVQHHFPETGYRVPKPRAGQGHATNVNGLNEGLQASSIETTPFSARQLPLSVPETPYHRKRRPRSPGLKWFEQYDGPDRFKNGRVLVIDYIKKKQSKQGMRKVVAQEFDSIHGLRRLYSTPDREGEPILRVIHCQNADWATRFLLHKFNIDARDDLVGTDFGKWVKYKRPERRGGKPFLNGKTWKTVHDPWRAISRSSFGLDYLKTYGCANYQDRPQEESKEKMFELNRYDEDDNPKYGFDVFVQRLSCYVQHKDSIAEPPDFAGVESPYDEERDESEPHRYVPQLDTLDNGNVIIMFENSVSNTVWDTLIGARRQWESRWRRLPFYLGVESHDLSSDDSMALECMKIILTDVFKSMVKNWENLLDYCNTHISILEDKIYDGPADESRAPELWTNSNMWLKVERLVAIHGALVKEMETNLQELTSDSEDTWLDGSLSDMEKLAELVQDDLVKPTANLADLMYKSVEIRDSRHSLQLNTSMWRLSWITFIFLPLTFISTFFGMNVDIIAVNPNIKYYFAAAVPLMVLVLLFWYFIKHSLAHERQTPYQRGIYEDMFYKMATDYPKLWARTGPREGIRPQNTLDRLKWRLLVAWNDPRKTIRKDPVQDAEYDDLGAWARLKRVLTRRWTGQLRSFDDLGSSSTTLEGGASSGDSENVVNEKMSDHTPMQTYTTTTTFDEDRLGVPVVTPGAQTVTTQPRIAISRPNSAGKRPSSEGSGSAGRSSGIMVEEEPESWLKNAGASKPVRY